MAKKLQSTQTIASIALVVVGTLLAGCAAKPTVSENVCRAGDWRTIGYRDGSIGVQNTRLLAHQEACGEFGIIPDRNGYMAGWSAGLNTYCTGDMGFQVGESGRALNTVCRAELREPFATTYAEGFKLYSARREVRQLSKQLFNDKRRVETIKLKIVDVTAAQINFGLSVEERTYLVVRLTSLIKERKVIIDEIPDIEQELSQAEVQLAGLDQTCTLC